MKNIDESWREFIEDGETTVYANAYQRANLIPLWFIMRTLHERRIDKQSLLGSLLLALLGACLKIVSFTSPYAKDLYWLRVEAAWFVRDYKYSSGKCWSVSYTYYRKEHLGSKEFKMLHSKVKLTKQHQLHNK